ncbi:MAG: methionyl-tRNA formyltransferase, partial [Halothiobacillaceae bacterium]
TEYHLPVFQPPSLKSEAVAAELTAHHADIMVVVAYGLILPPAVLAIPRLGCINIHASLLPRWRGAAPIQRAILAGDHVSGITIIQMEAGLDTGPMLHRVACEITPTETGQSLHDKLALLGGEAVVTALGQLEKGSAVPAVQENSQACYAAKLTKEEAWLDWSQPAAQIVRKVRAFNAWPVARTLSNATPLHIWEAVAKGDESRAAPGTGQ